MKVPGIGRCFVMWWMERQDRVRAATGLQDAVTFSTQAVALTDRLLEVIRSNTGALTELRDELRAHRASEAEWRSEMMKQMDYIWRRSASPLGGAA